MKDDSTYQKTLDYLYSFVDYSLTRSDRYSPADFDLNRMFAFMQRLNNPERNYPVLHIAGTKGKGSVAAMCASALQAAGYRVGLYTSPHLHDYAERIRINGQPIPHADMISLVDELKPTIASLKGLTTFEITTALGFLYFARQNVDAAVIEVGLGGRLDATNVVLPKVTVITSISYDHTHLLGNTLSEIAGEKAGIIKPGVPVVVAPQKEEARRTIERIAAERSAPLIQVGRDVLFAAEEHSLQSQSLYVWNGASALNQAGTADLPAQRLRLEIPLLGGHQVENAATAYTALQLFRQRGLAMDNEALLLGFKRTSWPGRFEVLNTQPTVVIDCAHNRDSALRLRQALDEYFPSVPVLLIFGVSEDKDIAGILIELMPRVDRVVVTRSFHPRAAQPESLAELAGQFGKPVSVTNSVAEALQAGLQLASPAHLILATGSIFIAAEVRETWLERMASGSD